MQKTLRRGGLTVTLRAGREAPEPPAFSLVIIKHGVDIAQVWKAQAVLGIYAVVMFLERVGFLQIFR